MAILQEGKNSQNGAWLIRKQGSIREHGSKREQDSISYTNELINSQNINGSVQDQG